jgi:DnaJ-class molecular chaperone
VNTITAEEYDDIVLHRPRNCPLCEGAGVIKSASGRALMMQTCEVCGGEGRVLIYREDSEAEGTTGD